MPNNPLPAHSAHERRATPRFPTSIDALVIEDGSVEGIRARVVDLSWGGARLETTMLFPHATPLRLLLQRADQAARVLFTARVVRSAPGMMGVTFGPLDEDSYAFLAAICGPSVGRG